MNPDDKPLIDKAAGRLVPSYYATRGRTHPSIELDLLTLVCSTGKVRLSHVEPEQAEVLLLCREALSIAEIAAHLYLPAITIKVLVSDLIEVEAVRTIEPEDYSVEVPDNVLEALLAGLQRRL